MPIDRKTGLMNPPIYPCAKAEGLCYIRFEGTGDFQCIYTSGYCKWRYIPKDAPEKDQAKKEAQ